MQPTTRKTELRLMPIFRAKSLPLRPIAEEPVFAEFREALTRAGVPE